MSDLISRKEAKLKVARVTWEDGDSHYDFHDKCVDCLDDVASAHQWIPVSEKYPKPEDEYKNFLTVDDKGEIAIDKFLLSFDEEPQPYFSGMRQIIAWMPLPKPYEEGKVEQ